MYKLYEFTALIDTGASFIIMLLSVVNHLGWVLLMDKPIEVRFTNGECLLSIGQSAGLV